MLEDFNSELKTYNEVINKGRFTDSEEGAAILENLFQEDRTKEIFGLQEKKKEVMDKLKSALKKIDEENGPVALEDKEQFTVIYKGGKYLKVLPNKSEVFISKGILMTDGEWGISYAVDPSVPRDVRKEFLIEEAKRKLQEYYDKQIILDKLNDPDTHEYTKSAYAGIKENDERGEMPPGILAEKIVKTMLKKYCIDAETDIDIYEPNAYQDVQQKIDFIIRRKSYHRGVEVETNEESGAVGVQFTTNADEGVQEKKKVQLDRVKEKMSLQRHTRETMDDMLLVTIPIKNVKQIYKDWSKFKRSGGPDRYMEVSMKETVIKEVLQGIAKPDEIEKLLREAKQS